jgi:hypothetical protein
MRTTKRSLDELAIAAGGIDILSTRYKLRAGIDRDIYLLNQYTPLPSRADC